MTTELAKRAVPKDSDTEPPMDHYRRGGDIYKALCGAKLRGGRPTYKDLCVVCEDLWNHGFR